ncbi:hypothetical protein MAR_008529 [Mya arenaria]|uniref:RRM domain-containing protein n=1 Tax=Mya arenaria TaxID=6604 RepID=A0ABY7DZ74_MYAAR|nr:hypothetical protein MAR_008529 [Mya arenaria]
MSFVISFVDFCSLTIYMPISRTNQRKQTVMKQESTNDINKEKEEVDADDEDDKVGSVLFVKNLNFNTMDETLIQILAL